LPGIRSISIDGFIGWAEQNGLPRFRAAQVLSWVYGGAQSFDEMTNLPLTLRTRLAEEFTLEEVSVVDELVSSDGTQKFVFSLADGQLVEGVLMHYRHGNTVCISTQAGCKMGCKFCASPPAGFGRNLTAGEMLGQVMTAGRACGGRVDNVVLMGIGEPLDNFDNVMRFLENLSDERGYRMSLRHVSLSTCGLVPRIDELAARKLQLTLSVSLHAPNDEVRNKIMPVNAKWGVDELLAACDRYFETTGRRICYEYALIGGVNDRREHALELASRLAKKGTMVNLIPFNPVPGTGFSQSSPETMRDFQQTLIRHGVNATVRRTLGSDLNASCGQLRRKGQGK